MSVLTCLLSKSIKPKNTDHPETCRRITKLRYHRFSYFFLFGIVLIFLLSRSLDIDNIAINVDNPQGFTMSATSLNPLYWTVWSVFLCLMAVLLPYCIIWVYVYSPNWMPALPAPSRDDWEGGFWHREDAEDADLEKGLDTATDAHFAFGGKGAGWDGQESS